LNSQSRETFLKSTKFKESSFAMISAFIGLYIVCYIIKQLHMSAD